MQQPADIVFVWPKNLGSWITTLGQGYIGANPPQHVCLVGENGKTLHTTGAKRFFYGEVKAEQYLKNKVYSVYRLKTLTNLQKIAVLIYSRSYFGTFYPFWDLVNMAIGRWNNRNSPNKLVYCSKAVATCYKVSGNFNAWELLEDEHGNKLSPYADITPEQIWDIAVMSGEFEKVKPTWLK